MTEEQLLILRRKINTLNNYSYYQGAADAGENWKMQQKYSALSEQAEDDIYDFVVQCLSTET